MRDTDAARTGAPIRLKPDSTESTLAPYATAVVEADALHEEPARMTYAEPTIFASALDEPRRQSGLGIWFAAAASLVLGIVIGFASGYRAGQGSSDAAATIESPAPTSGAASPGQPFSESSVAEPAPPPAAKEIVAEPEAPTASAKAPAPKPPAPTAPRPVEPPVGRTLSGPPGASDPGVPAAPAPRGGVARPTITPPKQAVPPPAVVEEKAPLTGPASLQVVSRPAGAEVIVDGKSVGRTPLSMEMSPGSHDIRLSLPGFKGWATTVDVKPGVTTRVSGSLEQ